MDSLTIPITKYNLKSTNELLNVELTLGIALLLDSMSCNIKKFKTIDELSKFFGNNDPEEFKDNIKEVIKENGYT